MESCDSGVTSPVLRVTAEITEIKEKHERSGNRNYSVSPSLTSRECKTHPACTKKKFLKPLYGYNPYERSNCGGSYVSSQHNPKNNVSSFTQRVMSAKLLRMKQLQNQLYETQAKLNEVMQENRTLKTVQQRQDSVLKKYEGNQEQLPQLMRSHHEEIRVLNEKYKQLRNNYKELESRLKQKDNELTNLREQHKHLLKLSKDKHLGEREKLSKKVEEMQTTIDEQRKKIFMLSKKLDLEEKSFNHQLNQEVAKQRKVQSELQSALETINNLKTSLEAKERQSTVSFRRPIQSSEKNLQTPLRVSFRQPQQNNHARTDNTTEHESETTDDSFTMNYSPEPNRSSSLETDSSGSTKEQKEPDNRTQPGSNSYVSILNTKLKNGLKISRNPPNISIHESAKHDQNLVIGKKELMFKTEESKVRRKLQAQREQQRPSTVKPDLRRSSLNKLPSNTNKTNDKESEKLEQISSEEQIKKSNKEKIVPSSSTESTEIKPGKTDVSGKAEKIDNGMKLDLDSEFEKYFQSTQLSDEAINEFYQKDFREEIFELERKFQELNQQNNEKIEHMKAVNRLSPIISSESDSEEINFSTELQQEENQKIETETSSLTENLAVSEAKLNIPLLGETQKADLLKALSNIDNASNKNAQGDGIELPQIANNPILTSEMSYLDKVNEIKKSYPRTRRKSEVMKDLFGGDAAVLKS
ncbi:lebercilin [Halyomorpha halys]|uniref:lebercilin n=1 Tax=Halyomorpha halys TaxID=286706 RepID=UPI0006D51DF6|nr:putative leucine-rich repeat-containing protein DDB_G0290503 [Halyomorpha halys]